MLKNLLLASVLGLCLFGVSFGQRDHDAPPTQQEMAENQLTLTPLADEFGKVSPGMPGGNMPGIGEILGTAKDIIEHNIKALVEPKQPKAPPEPKTRPEPRVRPEPNSNERSCTPRGGSGGRRDY
jgi:hypothetical protein